ncbi:hypothetical protein DIPPA_24202 [Diplonema papillatum]|nr:hypothetical protein DIPPA_24202 [Diplonema papillatum]
MGDSRLLVYFDGGARANGTAFAVAGAGAVVYRDGVKVAEVVLPLPTVRSNNVAEYEGLLAGLHLLGDAGEAEGEECTVRGDSALVVGHLARRMACSEELKPYLTRAALKVSSLQRRLTLHIEHVARELNTDADALSNAAMDLVQRQRPTRQQQETMLANFRRSGLGKALSLIEMGKAAKGAKSTAGRVETCSPARQLLEELRSPSGYGVSEPCPFDVLAQHRRDVSTGRPPILAELNSSFQF